MLFDNPVSLQANIWYVAWACISGPNSDCGSSGLTSVTTEDQLVTFYTSFKQECCIFTSNLSGNFDREQQRPNTQRIQLYMLTCWIF